MLLIHNNNMLTKLNFVSLKRNDLTQFTIFLVFSASLEHTSRLETRINWSSVTVLRWIGSRDGKCGGNGSKIKEWLIFMTYKKHW